jgi:hypothetical protein
MKWLATFQNEPFAFRDSEMNHLCRYGISVCPPLFKVFFSTVVLNGFLLLMNGSSLTILSLLLSFFFELGVTKDAAKSNCVLPIGDDGSLNGRCSSSELIVKINKAQL